LTQVACSTAARERQYATLELRSASFYGDTIPNAFSSCNGQGNLSPQLSWSTPPKGTRSFTLVVVDRDSPLWWNFVHWLIYDVPADKRELAEAVAKQEQLPDGSRQGRNGYDQTGYVGPCPPGHSPHHYVFTLFALDTKLNLPGGASKKQVINAIKGHILASGELVGQFQR
jgi:Raf kinase inhibitor-like YbhB/YbcL family protein